MTLDEKKLREIIREEIAEAVTTFKEDLKWEQQVRNKTGEHASVRIEHDSMLHEDKLVLLVGEKRGIYDTYFYLDPKAAKELIDAIGNGLRQMR